VVEIIMEYGGPDIGTMGPNIPFSQIYNFMRQSSEAFLQMSSHKISHYDIKPANIVYDAALEILKIIDFGISNTLKPEDEGHTIGFAKLRSEVRGSTPQYSPPEILMPGRVHLEKIDIYCWGMTFYSVILDKTKEILKQETNLYKMMPGSYRVFLENTKSDLRNKLIANKENLEMKTLVIDIIMDCLKESPSERPSFEEIVKRFEKLEEKKLGDIPYLKKISQNKQKLVKKYRLEPKPVFNQYFPNQGDNYKKEKENLLSIIERQNILLNQREAEIRN
jgi:serine/threonine protein kinase